MTRKPRPEQPAINASVAAVCPVCKERFTRTGGSALEVSAAYVEWMAEHQHREDTAA
jgi:hypothetical protein